MRVSIAVDLLLCQVQRPQKIACFTRPGNEYRAPPSACDTTTEFCSAEITSPLMSLEEPTSPCLPPTVRLQKELRRRWSPAIRTVARPKTNGLLLAKFTFSQPPPSRTYSRAIFLGRDDTQSLSDNYGVRHHGGGLCTKNHMNPVFT